MNSIKVEIYINWPEITNVKNIQNFLRFANFYRRFIFGFSKITVSLNALIKKNTLFKWIFKCQTAFEILKKGFISDIVFIHFNSNRKIIVETDIFDYVSAGILI
jgi:hypothetical protein